MCWTLLYVSKHKYHKDNILQTTGGKDQPNIVFMSVLPEFVGRPTKQQKFS